MRNYPLSRPPQPFGQSPVHLDNIALAPASLLPFKAQWQAIANDLPRGEILVVLPNKVKQQRVARFVAAHLRENGKHVQVMEQEPHRNAL